MKRRQYLRGVGAVTVGSALSGCSVLGEQGTLRTRVRGAPETIGSFRRLEITIDGIRLKPLEGPERDLDLDEPVALDLAQLPGDGTATVAEFDVAPGTYASLQLEGVTESATRQNGEPADFGVPGDADRLEIRKEFDVRAGQTTTFVAEIEAVHPGTTDTFVLQATASDADVFQPD